MKIYLILGILFVVANGEKKINLEDIEKDNLRAESKSKSGGNAANEAQNVKFNVDHQQHSEPPNDYNEPVNLPPSQQNIKLPPPPPPEYTQSNYPGNDVIYQQQNAILPEQNLRQLQYYTEYSQQPDLPSKDVAPPGYEQQFYYQPETLIGNQAQSIQQKSVGSKYTKNVNKETVYIDIPMSQLFSYYPNLNINSYPETKSGVPLGPQILQPVTSQTTQQISIPLYMSLLNQKQIITPNIKSHYQITKGAAKKPVASQLLAPLYIQPEQPYSHAKKLITQAYIVQPQPQYVQQLVYSPRALYTQPSHAYSDAYVSGGAPPSYVPDNTLQNQVNQQYAYSQYATDAEQISQQSIQSLSHNYVKVPEEPSTHFEPPHLPARNFNSGITQLVAISSGGDESLPVKGHVDAYSEPRSLLDTYIPSKLIAAQDSARYKERPLQLEGGFLPSKANFVQVHRKRKSQ